MANDGHTYRDLVAAYVERNFGGRALTVYTEVSVGKTIIGKNRRIDVLLVHEVDQKALAIECKWQAGGGTADEKIPYALQDVAAMWIPGCLAYGGTGWSKGVLHTLEGSRFAVACEPEGDLERTRKTLELDHVIGAVFGFWDIVLPEERLFKKSAQMQLPMPGLKPTRPREPDEKKHAG
jgi:hypothetical protein